MITRKRGKRRFRREAIAALRGGRVSLRDNREARTVEVPVPGAEPGSVVTVRRAGGPDPVFREVTDAEWLAQFEAAERKAFLGGFEMGRLVGAEVFPSGETPPTGDTAYETWRERR